MDTLTFPVNVATMIATPATVLTMTTSTTTKQVFAFEDPKQCNTDDGPPVPTWDITTVDKAEELN
ncbi:MAG TPA: hypothetical protein VE076_10960 [Nitrososphaeraceae archaeon]|jgi:hypothetical protein|nr:hypothetical protein [Nitrososphaeraceae archaeon]